MTLAIDPAHFSSFLLVNTLGRRLIVLPLRIGVAIEEDHFFFFFLLDFSGRETSAFFSMAFLRNEE